MGRFASGKNAFGISDRSGRRYPMRDLRKEWTGLLVGRDEYESKHPQLDPKPQRPDAQALRFTRPDRVEPVTIYVGVPTVMSPKLERPRAVGKVGQVTVSTT